MMARYIPVHVVLEDHHHIPLYLLLLCYYYVYNDVVINDYNYFVSELLSVSLVTQELSASCENWQDIGEELGVEQSSLEVTTTVYSDPGDCLSEVLRQQLRSCATTWKDIVAVLRTPRIGKSLLADHLEVKYCSSQLT